MKTWPIVGILGLSFTCPVLAIHKCTASDGSVAYQEQPCSSSKKSSVVTVVPTRQQAQKQAEEKAAKAALAAAAARAKVRETEQAEQKAKAEAERKAKEEKISKDTEAKMVATEARCGKPVPQVPFVGMKEERFLSCTWLGAFGDYTINETQTARGLSRQYVFSDALQWARYVYTVNGIVAVIQK